LTVGAGGSQVLAKPATAIGWHHKGFASTGLLAIAIMPFRTIEVHGRTDTVTIDIFNVRMLSSSCLTMTS
jgi:hypothetical protein